MAAVPSWLHTLLVDQSTDRYHIEYHGFLSNHLAHGCIALWWLGAEQHRVQQFIDWYVTKLEKPVIETEKVSDVSSLLGKRTHYNTLRSHYTHKLTEDHKGDVDSLIRSEFPKLSLGLSCSVFHGLIHLGYGYSVRSERVILEGLAYLNHSYSPLVLSEEKRPLAGFGKGKKPILDVLAEVKADVELREFAFAESKRGREKGKSGPFQQCVGSLFQCRGDRLIDYVNSIEIPLLSPEVSPGDYKVLELCDWVTDCAITVYGMASTRNDFVLIHGVTSAWSLSKIAATLADGTETNHLHVLTAVRVFLAGLLATYLALECPLLDDSNLDLETPTWEELIGQAVSIDRDEHVYKLVQVCRHRSQENHDAKMAELYRKCAYIAVTYPLAFYWLNI